MRIVVTGANGFVGRHLVEVLQSRGADVWRWVYGGDTAQLDGNTRQVDLRDAESVRQALALDRPERVVHLAARADVGASFATMEATWRINVLATMLLAGAMTESKQVPGMVFAASGDAYGETFNQHQPVSEEHPLKPLNPYSASKAAAEIGLEQLRVTDKMPVRVVRSFNCAGPGQAQGFVVSDFARQVARIVSGSQEPVIRVGNLSAKRDFLDVRDAAEAYADIAMLDESSFSGPPLNLCSGTSRSIRSVLDGLLSLSGCDIQVETDQARLRPSDIPLASGDNHRLRSLCGWAPKRPFEQTLRDALHDWRERSQA